MKLAILIPGYLDSPEYTHLITLDKELTKFGYSVKRLDICNLWSGGKIEDYTLSNALTQLSNTIQQSLSDKPEEIILVGHSMGGLLSIVAGDKFEEVTKVIAICPPPDTLGMAGKWVGEIRKSKRDLPEDSSKFREFEVPINYLSDSLKYSAVDSVKTLKHPLMILICMSDTSVPPAESEKIVKLAKEPHVVRLEGIGHDFRHSIKDSNEVCNEVLKYLQSHVR